MSRYQRRRRAAWRRAIAYCAVAQSPKPKRPPGRYRLTENVADPEAPVET